MQIFVINLDRRADRLAKMRAQLQSLGLAFTRIAAIDALAAPDMAANLGWRTPSLTPGEIGCALSHRLCWERLVASGEDDCLILEDDTLLSPKLADFLRARPYASMAAVIIRLETFRTKVIMTRRPCVRWRRFGLHRLHSQHSGTGGYIISRAFAQHLLETPYDRDLPVDNFLFSPRSAVFAIAKIAQVAPALCIQEKKFVRFNGVSDSDLGVRPRAPRVVKRRKRWDAARWERLASHVFPTARVWRRVYCEQKPIYQRLLRQRELE